MRFTLELIILGFCLGGLYALVAAGYSLVYGVLRFINFAHGEVFTIGAYFAYVAWHYLGISFPLALILIGAAGGAAVAALVERVVYRPLSHTSNLLLLVTSIGVSIILRNLVSILFGDQFRSLRPPSAIRLIPLGSLQIPVSELYALVGVAIMGAALWLLIWKTDLGLKIRAVANSRDSSKAIGINIPRVVSSAFVIGGAYAGSSGVFAGMISELTPQMGVLVGIKAFTIAVIGGIGNVTGSIITGFVVGILEALAIGYFGAAYRDTLVFTVLVVALLIRPKGILPPRSHV